MGGEIARQPCPADAVERMGPRYRIGTRGREGLLGAPPGADAQVDVDDVARGEGGPFRLVLPA